MLVTLSFDIEEFDFPFENGRAIDFESQLTVSSNGLEALLLLLNRLGIVSTFYTTANFAMHRPELIQRAVAYGHEIASHDYFHALESASDPYGSRIVLEQITGKRVIGYRAPRLNQISSQKLWSAGYKYNSSLNPTWIPGHYNNLGASRTLSNDAGLTIYPTSVSFPFRIPLFWLSLHVMPLSIYKILCNSALNYDGFLNLYFHPWEFSEDLRDRAFGIPRYITRCSGVALQNKLEHLLVWLQKRGCEFCTTRKYLGIDD